jgi:phospholipase C
MKSLRKGLLVLAVLGVMSAHAQNPIKHVIVIFQENRSTDNLFHGFPGADIANSGQNSKGKIIPLKQVPLVGGYDLSHAHSDFVAMYDNGKMDGADKIPVICKKGQHKCAPANPQFKYVNPQDVAPYFQMGEQYTFGDRMFQTNQGPSFPAHQFIIAGTSAPTETSDLFDETDAFKTNGSGTGCFAKAGAYVRLIDPSGNDKQEAYPCFEHQTLADLLDNAGITWRYYTSSKIGGWTGPNAIYHLWNGPDWKNVIQNPSTILTDISTNLLPGVSWVIPTWQESDHANFNKGLGPSWVASIVNAVGNSSYWSDTAIFVTWDDWGGWYDHVAPTIYDSYEYGFRVPLLVISSYAKPGYVSKVTHDFGSILRFTEEVFSLPSLGFADSRADDMMDCFQFNNEPHEFRPIRAPYDAHYFLTHKFADGVVDDD